MPCSPAAQFLSFAAAGAGAMLVAPRIAFASVATERRFVFMIQRGAADGLNIVVPYAEPAYATLRGALAIDPSNAIKLDGTFALHPALAQTARDVCGPSGAVRARGGVAVSRPFAFRRAERARDRRHRRRIRCKDGWLNRLVAHDAAPRGENAIAFAPTVPMALRGPAAVTSYAPSALPQAPDDLLARVSQLYDQDAQLRPLWESAMTARGLAGDAGARQDPASLGKLAASFLSRDDGPRIAMIETGGWDTHSAQNARLARSVEGARHDARGIARRHGPGVEQDTVLVATEFGRTAAANGTGGTDHGTASVAMVLGGAVKGGRVIADWPGLAPRDLYEARDLKPTTSLDAVIAGAASESFGLDPQRTAAALFGQTWAGRPVSGIVRA